MEQRERKKTPINKHSQYDLKQMQSLPLEAKILMTQQRIRAWYDYWQGDVYVSVSGMDSTVLKHIIDSMQYYDVPALFVNTGLEYPEIQAFWRDVSNGKYKCFNTDVTIVRPKMRFDDVIKTYGYPVISKEVSKVVQSAKEGPDGRWKRKCLEMLKGERTKDDGSKSMFNKEKLKFLLDADFPISHRCCDVMKKNPAKSYEKETGRKPFIGTLAEESKLREMSWVKYGCNAFEASRPTSQPLSFWTKQDILHYIKKYNVPYVSVYGDIVPVDATDGQLTTFDILEDYSQTKLTTTGCDRTGCIFCMFGCHLEKEPNRFKRLKETHPRQFEYCIGGGEYVYKMFKRDERGEWQEFDMAWEYDDGTPMSEREIERFAQIHSVGFAGYKEEDMTLKCEKRWQPNKEGLGMSRVLDYIGVKYD